VDVYQKIGYIHENPVRAGLVHNIADYVYSGAADYAGKKGLVDVTVL
jgi:putative transposase